MKPSSIKKVFGIISYFPDNDTPYHIETRRERSRRFRELLFKLEELWEDTDIMVIAQNWQDFKLPPLENNITVYEYPKLGILNARRELRKKFLESNYDYLIMLDDDAMIQSEIPQAYMDIIDEHPDGVGTLRKNQSPLQLFAISKAVYSQIDMPDVDAEKGEGFEDDIFVASCFAKFPDKAFMFPKDVVSETSFKYMGEGKCPSTWAREGKKDWNYMRNYTLSRVYEYEHQGEEILKECKDPNIDLIITYVNSSDNSWRRDFIKTTKTHNPSAVRYRSWGTLKYLFRGIEKYMPFVRNVVLIVAKETQVPAWVNKETTRIVYHEDFIPKKYLPTFNSCTIESFFWNIPNLSDRVIYFNDDMFPIKLLKESDFFTGDLPNIRFTEPESYNPNNIFRAQCRSGMDMIMSALNLPKYETGKIIRPYHISSAFTRNSFDKVKELCEPQICNTITNLRMHKNVNQYIYLYYNYFTNNYVEKTVDYKYFELSAKNIDTIVKEISCGQHHMVCLNDATESNDYTNVSYKLTTALKIKFPNKSKYEL